MDVEHHHVDAFELARLRLTVLSVKRIHLQSGQGIHAVVNVGAVGCLSSKSVLRSEHVPHVDAARKQGVDEVSRHSFGMHHARVVADHSHPFSRQKGQVRFGALVAQTHLMFEVGIVGLCAPRE